MKFPLVLIGGGGHCQSVINAAESQGYFILGVFDLPEIAGNTMLGYPVLSPDKDISALVNHAEFVVTASQIKNSAIRQQITDKIIAVHGRLATVIAASACVSSQAIIGAGTVVLHQAMIGAGAVIGENTIINTLVHIEQDAIIGNYCHISAGVMVNGDCLICDKVFIGSGTVLHHGISICPNTIIAAGSVVTKNINTAGVYGGNPVKLLKAAE